MALKLIIAGMRRSGTTIFFETVAQDRNLVCYDEPFNGWLERLPSTVGLKNPVEFVQLLQRDASEFWRKYVPIHPSQELKPGLSDEQREYLDYLGATGNDVMMDVTRCHFKVAALKEVAPDALLLHLYRPAAQIATSHLLPSGKSGRDKLRKWVLRQSFWTRPDRYDYWHLETIIGGSPGTLFAGRLEEIGLDPEVIYRAPAVARVLSYWRVNFEQIEKDGLEHFGEQFVSQSFIDFCNDPHGVLSRVYDRLGRPMPDFDFRRIHPPNSAFESESDKWESFGKLVGLSGV